MMHLAVANPDPAIAFTVSGARTPVARWCARHLNSGWAFAPVTRRCPLSGTITEHVRIYIHDADEAVLFWMKWADEIV
ncbi:hypothetical protein [Sphingomonas sp. GB1N7]|uniref:hypothetical protein n=1 Tax=Parasphingomonas caseinilytica TaxID=3096158 RepID=UPI002FC6A0DA